jgi:hypothetical protein
MIDPYVTSLLLGATGLGTMALSGIGRHGHAARGRASGHRHGHGKESGHAVAAARGAAKGIRSARSHGGRASHVLLALVSPKTLFSILLGFGASGLVMRGVLSGPALAGAALMGGVALERLLVTPIWNFLLRFGSNPALTLESCIADQATAVTSFDANGEGLVSIELDGQVVQVLGRLRTSDRALGARVRAGDRVRIEDVDSARNRCTVSAG